MCGAQFDIIWSFDTSVFFDFSRLTHSFNILHVVDLDQNFELKKASKSADLCLFSSQVIGKLLSKRNPNSYFINHGYNAREKTKTIQLPGQNPIKLVYAGNLNMIKLDWKTLFHTVKINSNADFIFIGPLDGSKNDTNITSGYRSKLMKLKNSHFIGRIHSNELINYYSAADGLLLCYQEKYHAEQSNPHKIMEYLGSGKPVIATKTGEFLSDGDLTLMTKYNSEYSSLVSDFVNNQGTFDSDELKNHRINFAKSNSYDQQIEKIFKLIDQTKR